jgi:hypothetical protein
MSDLVKVPRFKVGDKVQLKHGTRLIGTVSEARGTYTSHGNVLYHVHVPMEPEPLLLLLRENEIDKV